MWQLVLTLALGASAPQTAAQAMQAEGPNMSGVWILNEELSDDPRERMGEQRRRRMSSGAGGQGGARGQGRSGGGLGAQSSRAQGGRGQGSGGPGASGVRGFERLTIVHEGSSVAITDAADRSRTLQTDREGWQPAQRGEIKIEWKKFQLVVQRRGSQRGESTTKYGINPDGQLVVSMTLTMRRGGEMTFDRVYDRAKEDAENSGS